jgi:hypothetical protein
MRCEQFERRLHEVLDARVDPELDEPLHEHAEICPSCRELLGGYDVLLATVASEWVPTGTRQLSARVVDQWRQSSGHQSELPSPRPSRRIWQVVAGSLACAAALLVAISPLLQFNGREGDSALARVANRNKSSLGKVPAVALAGGELSPQRIEAMAHQTGRGLATLVLQFPDFDTSAQQDGPAWLAPVASSLKPFTPVGEPFNVLLRAAGTRGQSRSS